MEYLLVETTFAGKEEAEKIADILIDKKAAACVQVVGEIKSKYLWKGQKETSNEVLVLIKTSSEKYPEVERLIKENHSYETPEIIAIPIVEGSKEYLTWVEENTNNF